MKSQLNSQKNLASMAMLAASAMFLFASCSKDEMVQPADQSASAERLISNQTKGNESNAVVFHGDKKYTIGKTVSESASAEISDAKISEYKKSDSKLAGIKMESDAKSHSIGFSSNDKFSPAAPALSSSSSGVDGYKKADSKSGGIKVVGDAKIHSIGVVSSEKFSPAAPVSSSDVRGYKKADSKSGRIKMIGGAKSHVIGENAGDKVSEELFHEMPAAWIQKKADNDKCDCQPVVESKKLITEKNEK